jgi:hypothetical protein
MGKKAEPAAESKLDEYGVKTEEHAGMSLPIEPYGPSGMSLPLDSLSVCLFRKINSLVRFPWAVLLALRCDVRRFLGHRWASVWL